MAWEIRKDKISAVIREGQTVSCGDQRIKKQIEPCHGRAQAAWLPYWHRVKSKSEKITKKYGQWAPFMDSHLFEELLEQARVGGFIFNRRADRKLK